MIKKKKKEIVEPVETKLIYFNVYRNSVKKLVTGELYQTKEESLQEKAKVSRIWEIIKEMEIEI